MKYKLLKRSPGTDQPVLPVEDLKRFCGACEDRYKDTAWVIVEDLPEKEPDAMERILQMARGGDALAEEVAHAAGMTVLERRNIRGTILKNAAHLRVASYDGREHLVVPVVAIKEGVVFPMNATAPELVNMDAVAESLAGWNGEPVVNDHPEDVNGEPVMANSPEVLDKSSFGRVFNARIENDSLILDAYIDQAKALKVGAGHIVERLLAGELVDVSIGAFIRSRPEKGTWKGEPYFHVWEGVISDHLAFLPEGTPGACSVDMGCGAPRFAAQATHEGVTMKKHERIRALLRSSRVARGNGVVSALLAASEDELSSLEKAAEKGELGEPWYQRLLAPFRKLAESLSDTDVRTALETALAPEPGFIGVDTVYPEESMVIYAVMTGETILFNRRPFEVMEDGSVKLGNPVEEVRPVTRFEPVVAAASGHSGDATTLSTRKEDDAMSKTERLKALIASGKTLFTEADIETLAQLPDERIAALEASIKDQEKEPDPAAATPVVDDGPMTEEQFLARAPESVKQILAKHNADQKKEKETYINALKSHGIYDETELNAMSVQSLSKLHALASKSAGQKVDQSGRGLTTLSTTGNDEERVPSPSKDLYRERLLKSRGIA